MDKLKQDWIKEVKKLTPTELRDFGWNMVQGKFQLESQLTTLQADNERLRGGIKEILDALELSSTFPIMQNRCLELLKEATDD